MKLLAQFYACLAIIVFIAVIGGIEARSSIGSSNFITAGNRGDLFAEHGSEDIDAVHEHQRERRSAAFMNIKDEHEPPKQADEKEKHQPPRNRRHVPKEDDIPKKPQAEDTPEAHKHRSRRQMPPGMPDPKDMGKQMPMPGHK